MPNPNSKIDAFRKTDKRWLVSVAMVSEGVDIKRLRVLLYLPNAMTELAFRQAIGRVVRTMGHDDDTRAYVVMPSFETFENYARRVEDEMSPRARNASEQERFKRCSECGQKCSLSTTDCPVCDTTLPVAAERLKACGPCGYLNPIAAKECHGCGESFSHDIKITLEEALRNGAIARGMDIEEHEVREAEDLAPLVRNRILGSGDHRLIKIIQTLPDESWARLRNIFENG